MKMNQSQEKQDGEKLCYQNNFCLLYTSDAADEI